MQTESTSLGFPFFVDASGHVARSEGDETIRGRIIQVLFTAPGERVNLPEFGCGLLNLVFEPNDDILLGATRFSIGQALTRWLSDEINVDAVDLERSGEFVIVEVVYTRKRDLVRHAVRIQFR
jgi:phage baseplate assembly protein W